MPSPRPKPLRFSPRCTSGANNSSEHLEETAPSHVVGHRLPLLVGFEVASRFGAGPWAGAATERMSAAGAGARSGRRRSRRTTRRRGGEPARGGRPGRPACGSDDSSHLSGAALRSLRGPVAPAAPPPKVFRRVVAIRFPPVLDRRLVRKWHLPAPKNFRRVPSTAAPLAPYAPPTRRPDRVRLAA